jgi:hypothetical protein
MLVEEQDAPVPQSRLRSLRLAEMRGNLRSPGFRERPRPRLKAEFDAIERDDLQRSYPLTGTV